LTVSKTVLDQYSHYQAAFDRWCQRAKRMQVIRAGEPMELQMVQPLDASLADYLDVLNQDGVRSSEAEKVVAAVVHRVPTLLAKQLSQTQKVLKGFRRVRPGGSRPALPDPVLFAMAIAGKRLHPGFPMAVLAA
jgi:hypothetical protein